MRDQSACSPVITDQNQQGEIPLSKLFWLLACFTASGMSGLIYEVAWMRSLELIFGATTFAVATVLAAFMGGLAFGSFSIGRISRKLDRIHPLKVYSLLEVAIAITGIVVPLFFGALIPVYQGIWKTTHASFFTFSALRFLISAVVLLLPTFLMGATLPVVSSYVNRTAAAGKRQIGLLYTFNTVGAVGGCLAAGLWLFPTIGLQKTQWVAISLNLVAALGGFVLSREKVNSPASDTPIPEASPEPQVGATSLQPSGSHALIFVYALSGFVAMLYEVSWSRVLVLILGSSTYACTIMLATFLFGLALGAFAISRFRLKNPLMAAGFCQIFIGLTTYCSLLLVEEIPWLYTHACETWKPGVQGLLLLQIGFSALLMILPTLGLGAMFPITIQSLRTQSGDTARVVGWAYALNTLGAIAGSVLAGFYLVPVLGSQVTLETGIGLNLGLALLCLGLLRGPRVLRWRPATAVLLVVFTASLFLSTSKWDPTVLSTGVFRYARQYFGLSRQGFRDHAARVAGDILQFKEGLTCTVTVFRNPECVSLLVNGKPDASTPSGLNPESNLSALDKLHDLPTQILLGQVPLLLAPKQDRVMVVGLGSGVTVGSVLTHPVREVECVELEDAVVRGSQFFEDYNGQPLADPRLKLVVNDARNHLLVTDKSYDVIISEPSNPWIPGAASLFTKDFFNLAASKLSSDGVFCQWIQLYELQEQHFQTILRTFTSVFPEAHLFRVKHDAILVGSKKGIPLSASALQARWTKSIRDDLERIRIQNLEQLLAWYWIGGAELSKAIQPAPFNTDDNMLIEFAAPLQVLASHSAGGERPLTQLFETSSGALPMLQLSQNTIPAEFWSRVARATLDLHTLPLARTYARASLGLARTPLASSVLALSALMEGRDAEAEHLLQECGFPEAPETLRAWCLLYSRNAQWSKTVDCARKLLEVVPGDPEGTFQLGRGLFLAGDHSASAAIFSKLHEDLLHEAEQHQLPFFLGSLALEQKRYAEAAKYYRHFIRFQPGHTEARTLLADALYHTGFVSEAAEQWQIIARLNNAQASQLTEEAVQASQKGETDQAGRLLSEAARLDSGNANLVMLRARLKQKQNDKEGAIQVLKSYLDAHPNRPDAVGYLSQFLAEGQKTNDARLEAARYRALTGRDWVEVH